MSASIGRRLSLRLRSFRGALAAAAIAAAFTTAGTGQAEASYVGSGRWCADLYPIGFDIYECQYDTWEQCWARASGISNVCYTNPYYVPRGKPKRRHTQHRRRY